MALRMPLDPSRAKQLNIQIIETIYHAALAARSELAERKGTYDVGGKLVGSPAQHGQLQHNFWGVYSQVRTCGSGLR